MWITVTNSVKSFFTTQQFVVSFFFLVWSFVCAPDRDCNHYTWNLSVYLAWYVCVFRRREWYKPKNYYCSASGLGSGLKLKIGDSFFSFFPPTKKKATEKTTFSPPYRHRSFLHMRLHPIIHHSTVTVNLNPSSHHLSIYLSSTDPIDRLFYFTTIPTTDCNRNKASHELV